MTITLLNLEPASKEDVGSALPILELKTHQDLTLQDIEAVARHGQKVSISQDAWENIKAGHQLVLEAAMQGMPVYGLTRGVGWNKDKPVFQGRNGEKFLSQDLLDLSVKFNCSSLRAHALGLGQPLAEEVVRAGMLLRLKAVLKGETGVQAAVAQAYLDFLNHGITPLVPSRGTVGEADITLGAHIGLAMIGEWDVVYQGQRLAAKQVMADLQIPSLEPIGKDFLSIISNNSLMAGKASLFALDCQRLLDKQLALFTLILEGYNGNIAPFSLAASQARPFVGMSHVAERIRQLVQGSDLLKQSKTRALQDPLSFRTMAYTLGAVWDNIEALKAALTSQNNSSDDNPLVLLDAFSLQEENEQLSRYLLKEGRLGAILPTGNFNFLPVTNRLEYLNQSWAKLAEVMTQQLIRLENPDLTQLSRFLAAPSNPGHAFGAIQKPFLESNVRIKQLAQPLSFSSATLVGNIEDTATMSGLILQNGRAILEGIYELSAFQLLHATQALDLRQGFECGASSRKIWQAYRKQVPFVQEDVAYTSIIEKSIAFWKAYDLIEDK